MEWKTRANLVLRSIRVIQKQNWENCTDSEAYVHTCNGNEHSTCMQANNDRYKFLKGSRPSLLNINRTVSFVLHSNDRRYSFLLRQVSQVCKAGTSVILFCNVPLDTETSETCSWLWILESSGIRTLWQGVMSQVLRNRDLHPKQTWKLRSWDVSPQAGKKENILND